MIVKFCIAFSNKESTQRISQQMKSKEKKTWKWHKDLHIGTHCIHILEQIRSRARKKNTKVLERWKKSSACTERKLTQTDSLAGCLRYNISITDRVKITTKRMQTHGSAKKSCCFLSSNLFGRLHEFIAEVYRMARKQKRSWEKKRETKTKWDE